MPVETFLRAKFEGLAERGVMVTVSATREEAHAPVVDGTDVVWAPSSEEAFPRLVAAALLRSLQLGLRSPAALRATIRAVRKPIRKPSRRPLRAFFRRLRSYLPLALLAPDIVHFEWNTAAIHYLPMAQVWGCPTVVSCHGGDTNMRPYLPDSEPYARWLRESFKRVTATHCVSDAVADQAIALGMERSRVWLVRPAVDTSYFRPAADVELRPDHDGGIRPLRIVSAGDLLWLKGHEYAVRVVAELVSRGMPVRLEIIGGAPWSPVGEVSDRPRIDHAIARLGLDEHINLTGRLSWHEVRARMQAADVLLHCSLTEGLPCVVLEAMACGKPVVVCAFRGVEEAVDDGVDGFIVPLRGVMEAANTLQALHDDDELRARMGRAARERVVRSFSLDRQLHELMTMYTAIRAGVRHSLRPPASAQRGHLRLLGVGPLEWTQGFDDALHAVSIVRGAGIDCRLRIFGQGPYLGPLWFIRHQLDLEEYVELRTGEELSVLATKPCLASSENSSELSASSQWRRQLEWADVVIDTSLRDAPRAALAGARAAQVRTISAAGDPYALAESLLQLADLGEDQADATDLSSWATA
jgi:glycosyltransferase involved in cell wall biosynthesis